ncbi:monosaccharide-sensing protein 2-like isoform X2 [Musa acuminata AAA Group]|uniref:monosaccharide-sensing protein 2-like isoform X2 n=1 Tax=Musa acuminata AAA Group TaxID=214697 RepID=UPI0031CE977D
MQGAVLVAIAASIGNLLQGWDNATIAGAVLYIKKEFKLESEPTIEGLIVAMSLIGATIITTFSGAVSDLVGRRPLLIISSVLYFVSGLIMLWSPNVYVLLLARLIDGFGIGLAVTLVPVYISETAPSEIRGLLNTLPQFSGSGGMFLSYCMVFGMSLMANPAWRVMLGVLSIPSLLYFLLTIFCLPESPRWLVSKGKMLEAKLVLQRLHGREDVSGEMALLVEGLGVGGETSIEEYIIGPANELPDDQGATADTEQITLYGPEEGLSWVARPVKGQSILGSAFTLLSRHGSMEMQSSVPLMDPLVTLFGSVHEKLPEMGSLRSTMFPNFGSMFSVAEQQLKNDQWDEESLQQGSEDYAADAGGGESDDNVRSPLLSRQTTSLEGKDIAPPHESSLSLRQTSSPIHDNTREAVGSMGIGGGWQLAWKWSERESEDGKKEEGFKRIYLHQEAVPESHRGSRVLLQGGEAPEGSAFVQAAALVSQPALFSKELMDQHPVGPAMVHPSETAGKGPRWSDLFEPGVRRALFVGIGIQILQQVSSAVYHPHLNSITGCLGCGQPCGAGQCGSCSALHSQCHCILLLLCHGFWTNPKYPLLGNLPNSGPWCLHSYLCTYILDRRYHSHLHPTCDVEHNWPCWRVCNLLSSLYHSFCVRVSKGSRNKRHASGGYCRVLCCWHKTSCSTKLMTFNLAFQTRTSQPSSCISAS